MINKEYGSDFHLCLEDGFLQPEVEYLFGDETIFPLFFSGRSAIYSLLEFGIKNSGWKRVFFPSYYCHEVVQFIRKLPIEIIYYEFNPFLDTNEKDISINDHEGNVLINVSFFGLNKLKLKKYKNLVVIEDLTHDILSYRDSKADYCFCSLRKQLPIPCGGFCYSATKKNLPKPEYNTQSDEIAVQKKTAMFLKREYLEGRLLQKEVFRHQFIEAEGRFEEESTNSRMPIIAQTIFAQLNVGRILETKKTNLKLAFQLLKNNNKVACNIAFASENALGLILRMRSFHARENLKAFLISKNIFPSILWPDQIEPRDVDTGKTVLLLHMDYRYNSEDIEYIIQTLNRYFS